MTLPSELPKDDLVEKTQVSLSKLNLTADQTEEYTENSNSFLLPQYKDITKFLDEATDEFEIGQLVHLESFGLYDAMSSIEIMDPKMDSGMILDSDLNKPPFNLRARLKPKEVLGIIDHLFNCEMTWHSGHSLSQTLFTCMYFHHVSELNPELFINSPNDDSTDSDSPIEFVILVLKSYVLGTIKCCHLVWDEMTKGNVYEEEDFSTNKYGISMYENFPDSQCIKLIEDAEAWMEQHGCKWIRQKGQHDCENVIRAILSRLHLRKSFLLVLLHMSQSHCQQYLQAQRHLNTSMQLLNGIKEGASINCLNLGVDVSGAFDPLINRKLVSQTPPRPIRLLTMQESINEMMNMLKSINATCEIINYKSATSLMNFLVYHASQQPPPCAFSRSILQSTICTENRILGKMSMFQLIKDSVTELTNPPYVYFAPKIDINASSKDDRIDENRSEISKLVHNFVDSTVKPLTDLYRILCHNRSRQRRNMCKVLTDWDLLQEEASAEHIDTKLQSLTNEEPIITEEGPSYSFHLSSWVYHRKLVLLEDILFLGFELDLYGTHEYVMIYWYIDYLLGVHYQHLERTHMHVTENKKSKSQQENLRSAPPPTSTVSLLTSQRMMIIAKQDICRGIHRTVSALRKTGHAIFSCLEFDDESTRFWHRFRMYRTLGSPTILSYKDFKDMTQFDNITAMDLFNVSLQNFQAARSSIERLLAMKPPELRTDLCHADFTKELQAMLRVCIANIVSLHKIIEECKPKLEPNTIQENEIVTTSHKQQKQKQRQKNKKSLTSSSVPPSSSSIQTQKLISLRKDNKVANFEFKYHPWYPVITLK
ncbi:Mak10-domain-containing protein [Rhizophagus irregularis]|uniref:Mak10-domain-containing protein n=1 Tax=Rhizophagus irregularis TaxID=588596 RepID=A0A2N0RXD7_9GLOM|nr:Mak10-domain-containing protein [Rhizophagus irregularis]PKC67952.1 Mak10-domain-containing protein [Rhizophagus irregularis]